MSVQDLIGERLELREPELVHELRESPASDVAAHHLRVEVAQDQVGQARVGLDEADERLVRPSLLVELHDRDEQAFLVRIACLGGIDASADIHHVAGGREQRHAVQPAEHRCTDRDVVEMSRRLPWIVGHQHVAGTEARHRIRVEKVPNGERHGVDVAGRPGHGLRHHVTAPIEDAGRQISGLPHHGRERGALKRRRLLVDDGDQPVPTHLEGDRVEGHAGLTLGRLARACQGRAAPPGTSRGIVSEPSRQRERDANSGA